MYIYTYISTHKNTYTHTPITVSSHALCRFKQNSACEHLQELLGILFIHHVVLLVSVDIPAIWSDNRNQTGFRFEGCFETPSVMLQPCGKPALSARMDGYA